MRHAAAILRAARSCFSPDAAFRRFDFSSQHDIIFQHFYDITAAATRACRYYAVAAAAFARRYAADIIYATRHAKPIIARHARRCR